MSDEKKDDKKTFPAWLNDSVSLIAALAGLFVTWQTIQINQRIDHLQENVETSKFVGELIGPLTDQKSKQDIALLALYNALASDPREDGNKRLERNKKLVAQVANRLLNNLLTPQQNQDVLSQTNESKKQGETAKEILYRLANLDSQHEWNCQELTQELERARKKSSSNASSNSVISNGSKNLLTSEEIALIGLVSYHCGNEKTAKNTNSSPNTAISPNLSKAINKQSKEKNGSLQPIVVTPENDTDRTLAQKQKLLDVATSANAVASVTAQNNDVQGVVYLLYDDPAFKANMEKVKKELKDSKWFVPGEPFLVPPASKNCANRSSIRFFNSGDDNLARDLKVVLGSKAPKSVKEHTQNIKLINLSKWSGARLVPEKQLELWVISKGADCKN